MNDFAAPLIPSPVAADDDDVDLQVDFDSLAAESSTQVSLLYVYTCMQLYMHVPTGVQNQDRYLGLVCEDRAKGSQTGNTIIIHI